MLIEDNAVVEVVIHYRKNGRRYDAYTVNEFKKAELDEEKRKLFSVLKLEMKELTWGMYNDLQESAMVEGSGIGERTFNFKVYKETRLKRLLVKWDAKDKDKKPVPINDKVLSQLAPTVAEAILRGYDEISFLSEDEEKNS